MTAPSGDQQRTDLAFERTVLAWWRTGLASLAVALGVGRLLPELSDDRTTWPYVALGVAFGLYSFGLFVYGGIRSQGLRSSAIRPFAVAATVGSLLAISTIAVVAAG